MKKSRLENISNICGEAQYRPALCDCRRNVIAGDLYCRQAQLIESDTNFSIVSVFNLFWIISMKKDTAIRIHSSNILYETFIGFILLKSMAYQLSTSTTWKG